MGRCKKLNDIDKVKSNGKVKKTYKYETFENVKKYFLENYPYYRQERSL